MPENRLTFRFRSSYQDTVSYEVWGRGGAIEIQVYRYSEFMEPYMRQTYNGDAAKFEREVVSRYGGVAMRQNPYRMERDLYEAFCEWLKQGHADSQKTIAAMYARYGESFTPEPIAPLPRPIYYDHAAQTYLTEPWFTEQA